MQHGTPIEWTHWPGRIGQSWNPIGGCEIESPGCRDCYAMRLCPRLGASRHVDVRAIYAGVVDGSKKGPVFNGKMTAAPPTADVWFRPLKWRRPSAIFVGDMCDVFHPARPLADILRVLGTGILCRRHIIMLLTKRPQVMARILLDPNAPEMLRAAAFDVSDLAGKAGGTWKARPKTSEFLDPGDVWPPPNLWIGCSAEDQKRADARRAPMHALAQAGWKTFVSYEPAIGPVNWSGWEFLRWLIAGGESGPRARPMHPQWARQAMAWCGENDIARFFKQWGRFAPASGKGRDSRKRIIMGANGHVRAVGAESLYDDDVIMIGLGKKHSGARLDGVEYRQFPSEAA